MGDMMGGGMMGGMGWWMALWALFGVAVLVLVVVGSVRFFRRASFGPEPTTGRESPQELLGRRYAAGEIDEDDYLRRRSGLS